ncbi:hypothetical protein STPH2_2604 [Streptomyces sp. KO7888]|nr:hypothetical protein [Streptomyces sp. KO7888]
MGELWQVPSGFHNTHGRHELLGPWFSRIPGALPSFCYPRVLAAACTAFFDHRQHLCSDERASDDTQELACTLFTARQRRKQGALLHYSRIPRLLLVGIAFRGRLGESPCCCQILTQQSGPHCKDDRRSAVTKPFSTRVTNSDRDSQRLLGISEPMASSPTASSLK